ncbi:hypothetical protein BGZ73_006893 [Actinomortierella ambigua]|nr:hypothetical protein BGZ73_006893 [Actinomortierella ambigua]
MATLLAFSRSKASAFFTILVQLFFIILLQCEASQQGSKALHKRWHAEPPPVLEKACMVIDQVHKRTYMIGYDAEGTLTFNFINSADCFHHGSSSSSSSGRHQRDKALFWQHAQWVSLPYPGRSGGRAFDTEHCFLNSDHEFVVPFVHGRQQAQALRKQVGFSFWDHDERTWSHTLVDDACSCHEHVEEDGVEIWKDNIEHHRLWIDHAVSQEDHRQVTIRVALVYRGADHGRNVDTVTLQWYDRHGRSHVTGIQLTGRRVSSCHDTKLSKGSGWLKAVVSTCTNDKTVHALEIVRSRTETHHDRKTHYYPKLHPLPAVEIHNPKAVHHHGHSYIIGKELLYKLRSHGPVLTEWWPHRRPSMDIKGQISHERGVGVWSIDLTHSRKRPGNDNHDTYNDDNNYVITARSQGNHMPGDITCASCGSDDNKDSGILIYGGCDTKGQCSVNLKPGEHGKLEGEAPVAVYLPSSDKKDDNDKDENEDNTGQDSKTGQKGGQHEQTGGSGSSGTGNGSAGSSSSGSGSGSWTPGSSYPAGTVPGGISGARTPNSSPSSVHGSSGSGDSAGPSSGSGGSSGSGSSINGDASNSGSDSGGSPGSDSGSSGSPGSDAGSGNGGSSGSGSGSGSGGSSGSGSGSGGGSSSGSGGSSSSGSGSGPGSGGGGSSGSGSGGGSSSGSGSRSGGSSGSGSGSGTGSGGSSGAGSGGSGSSGSGSGGGRSSGSGGGVSSGSGSGSGSGAGSGSSGSSGGGSPASDSGSGQNGVGSDNGIGNDSGQVLVGSDEGTPATSTITGTATATNTAGPVLPDGGVKSATTDDDNKRRLAAILGGIFGLLALIVVVALLFVVARRRRRRAQDDLAESEAASAGPGGPDGEGPQVMIGPDGGVAPNAGAPHPAGKMPGLTPVGGSGGSTDSGPSSGGPGLASGGNAPPGGAGDSMDCSVPGTTSTIAAGAAGVLVAGTIASRYKRPEEESKQASAVVTVKEGTSSTATASTDELEHTAASATVLRVTGATTSTSSSESTKGSTSVLDAKRKIKPKFFMSGGDYRVPRQRSRSPTRRAATGPTTTAPTSSDATKVSPSHQHQKAAIVVAGVTTAAAVTKTTTSTSPYSLPSSPTDGRHQPSSIPTAVVTPTPSMATKTIIEENVSKAEIVDVTTPEDVERVPVQQLPISSTTKILTGVATAGAIVAGGAVIAAKHTASENDKSHSRSGSSSTTSNTVISSSSTSGSQNKVTKTTTTTTTTKTVTSASSTSHKSASSSTELLEQLRDESQEWPGEEDQDCPMPSHSRYGSSMTVTTTASGTGMTVSEQDIYEADHKSGILTSTVSTSSSMSSLVEHHHHSQMQQQILTGEKTVTTTTTSASSGDQTTGGMVAAAAGAAAVLAAGTAIATASTSERHEHYQRIEHRHHEDHHDQEQYDTGDEDEEGYATGGAGEAATIVQTTQITLKLSIIRYERSDAHLARPTAPPGTLMFSQLEMIHPGDVQMPNSAFSHVRDSSKVRPQCTHQRPPTSPTIQELGEGESSTTTNNALALPSPIVPTPARAALTSESEPRERTLRWMKDEVQWKREAGMLQHLRSEHYIAELFTLYALPSSTDFRFVSVLSPFTQTLGSYMAECRESRALEGDTSSWTASTNSISAIREVVESVTAALKWCHDHHVVHLNLTPESIFRQVRFIEASATRTARSDSSQPSTTNTNTTFTAGSEGYRVSTASTISSRTLQSSARDSDPPRVESVWKIWNFGQARFVGEVVDLSMESVNAYTSPEVMMAAAKEKALEVAQTAPPTEQSTRRIRRLTGSSAPSLASSGSSSLSLPLSTSSGNSPRRLMAMVPMDMWSLGLLIYELYTYQPMFTSGRDALLKLSSTDPAAVAAARILIEEMEKVGLEPDDDESDEDDDLDCAKALARVRERLQEQIEKIDSIQDAGAREAIKGLLEVKPNRRLDHEEIRSLYLDTEEAVVEEVYNR